MSSPAAPETVLLGEVRPGSYHDSIVLMELQVSLSEREGVHDAGVVMATRSNLELLRDSGLLFAEAAEARDEDLVVAVRADSQEAGQRALASVDELLRRRRTESDAEYRPHSLDAALAQLPEARWVLVSVPGRYAADVARDALERDCCVFLYSDNVSLEDEAELKGEAARRGLLVLGPDCGTALVGGAGFGFVNRVRTGPIGLVGPSGTGLQTVASLLHHGGGGVSQILGTGGRDLSPQIAGSTTIQALDLLDRDPGTEVVVVVSKPPEPAVARRVVDKLHASQKPAVVYFQGLLPPHAEPPPATSEIAFARTLDEAAELALQAAGLAVFSAERGSSSPESAAHAKGGLLRGLFSGGTLALETLLFLRRHLRLSSNLSLEGVALLEDAATGNGHAILDLGVDELTVGRLHPMIDYDLRLRRLATDAADSGVGVVFLDVVLGDGAHPDPATALASAVRTASRSVDVVALVIGTDEDPQDRDEVCRSLQEAGAQVFHSPRRACEHLLELLGSSSESTSSAPSGSAAEAFSVLAFGADPNASVVAAEAAGSEVDLELLAPAVRAINFGLESFFRSLREQGVEAVHVDWRPPAGGNRRLQGILEKMKASPG